jgi:hypothetical protein
MIENIKIIDNFISDSELELIMSNVFDINSIWVGPEGQFFERELVIKNDPLLSFKKVLLERIQQAVIKEYSLDHNVYEDGFGVIRRFPGDEHGTHFDGKYPVMGQRVFGAVMYLNSDFKGGRTFYPDYDLEIEPVPKRLIIHPGTIDYIHGVTEIESGMRYTVSAFWSKINLNPHHH